MFTEGVKPDSRSYPIVFVYDCFSFEIMNNLKILFLLFL